MATEEADTDRVAVRTYVPEYQRAEWDSEAEALDMSRAEYVRSMVQAGRREFSVAATPTSTAGEEQPRSGDANPGGNGLRTRMLDVLDSEGPCEWDELVAGVTGDLEQRLEEQLESLKHEGAVHHDARGGGYRVSDDGE